MLGAGHSLKIAALRTLESAADGTLEAPPLNVPVTCAVAPIGVGIDDVAQGGATEAGKCTFDACNELKVGAVDVHNPGVKVHSKLGGALCLW